MAQPQTVFVSGATGFIAQHVVKLLLFKGYKVIGSVRSTERGERLKGLLKSELFQYEVVADIEPPNAFDAILQKHTNISVFLHTASPFHYKTTDIENDLYKPAINGTINALSAIKKYGTQITHVVITSSYVAMMDVHKFNDPEHTDTEKTWSPINWEEGKANAQLGYYALKKLAEVAAWDFIEKEKPGYIVNFVNPTLVFGPQLFDEDVKAELNASSEIVNGILKLKHDSPVPEIASVCVDVRDVAKAHLVAFESAIKNERLLLYSSKFTGQGILNLIHEHFDDFQDKLPIGNPANDEELLKGLCQIDNRHTLDTLGFKLIDLEHSVVDTVSQIVRAGKQV